MRGCWSLRAAIAAGVGVALVGIGVAGRGLEEANWPYWRGPAADGMAVGDAPVQWSDTQHVRWKVDIPGLGNSSPVVWGDQVFVTTAVKTGELPPGPSSAPPTGAMSFRGASGLQAEHKFDVLALDRKTGKTLWQRTATTAITGGEIFLRSKTRLYCTGGGN